MHGHTCVSAAGCFIYGIHKPQYKVTNLRKADHLASLGNFKNGNTIDNKRNFPSGDIEVEQGDWIYEIPNPFPFRGTTYIGKKWADKKAEDPESIILPGPPPLSFTAYIKRILPDHIVSKETIADAFKKLPEPILLTVAANSTDPEDLTALATICCEFVIHPQNQIPTGLVYTKDQNDRVRPVIRNHDLFETLVNNLYLPDSLKEVMVLRPGVQGASEIVGDWQSDNGSSHIYEYLRRNSYIPWGHYASNMANDAVRYRIHDLTTEDMTGLRHLYYQRVYMTMAEQLGVPLEFHRRKLSPEDLEELRIKTLAELRKKGQLPPTVFNSTLWGWNYGFDFAPSGYRMHASHQQVHQQFALIPPLVETWQNDQGRSNSNYFPSFACGDLIRSFTQGYRETTGLNFFDTYIKAIRNNERMDNRKDLDNNLVIHQDDHVMLFVPKAQTSQWELQLMTIGSEGNILEASTAVRTSLDRAILIALKVLTALGAKMITTIEFSKRFDHNNSNQRLLYSFLPKLPESPGAMSEAQLRFINGHYPEDFARACRRKLATDRS